MKGTASIGRALSTMVALLTLDGAGKSKRPNLTNPTLAHVWGGHGSTPDVWGTSQACRKLHRQNRLRALGIGGQRR